MRLNKDAASDSSATTRQRIILGVLLALVVGVVAGVTWTTFRGRATEGAAEEPQGQAWICKGCGKGFHKDVPNLQEVFRNRSSAAVQCPHCGQANAVPARQCPHCQKYFERPSYDGSGRPMCPECKEPLPRPNPPKRKK